MPRNKPATRPIPSALAGRPLYDYQPKGWLKLSEVMQVLQISQRQVQRFQTERRFRNLASLAQAGARPQTLYDIREVHALAKELEAKRQVREQDALVVRNAAGSEMERRRSSPPGRENGKLAAFEAVVMKFVETWQNQQQNQQRYAALNQKFLLTIEESKLFGFTETFLRNQARAGKLRNFGGPKRYLFSRFDLAAMVGGDCPEDQRPVELHGKLSELEMAGLKLAKRR